MRILLATVILICGFGAATTPTLADGGGANTGGNQTCNDNGKC